jgi:hypothetical protein
MHACGESGGSRRPLRSEFWLKMQITAMHDAALLNIAHFEKNLREKHVI